MYTRWLLFNIATNCTVAHSRSEIDTPQTNTESVCRIPIYDAKVVRIITTNQYSIDRQHNWNGNHRDSLSFLEIKCTANAFPTPSTHIATWGLQTKFQLTITAEIPLVAKWAFVHCPHHQQPPQLAYKYNQSATHSFRDSREHKLQEEILFSVLSVQLNIIPLVPVSRDLYHHYTLGDHPHRFASENPLDWLIPIHITTWGALEKPP